jgi:hypothetical protein
MACYNFSNIFLDAALWGGLFFLNGIPAGVAQVFTAANCVNKKPATTTNLLAALGAYPLMWTDIFKTNRAFYHPSPFPSFLQK